MTNDHESYNHSYFLLINFGETLSRFFLISFHKDKQIKIEGPVEILTQSFREKEANDYFLMVIAELEKISGRKLIKRNLLLVLNSETNGVQEVSILGEKELENSLDILKVFKLISHKEGFLLTIDVLEKLGTNFNLLEVSSKSLYFGQCHEEIVSSKVIAKGVTDFLLKTLNNDFNLEKVKRWLPFEIDLGVLENYLANKSIYPQTIPLSLRDLAIDQALLREVIRENKPDFFIVKGSLQKIILTGSFFSKVSNEEQIILVAIDSLELEGISYLYFDEKNCLKSLIPILSKFKKEQQEEVVSDILSHIVSVISFLGPIVNRRSIGKVMIDQGFNKKQELSLEGGELNYLPLQGKMKLRFELLPGYGVFANQLKNRKKKDKNIFELEVIGGKKGIIFDVRGRPLTIFGGREGNKQIISWNQALNIYQKIQEIGESLQ